MSINIYFAWRRIHRKGHCCLVVLLQDRGAQCYHQIQYWQHVSWQETVQSSREDRSMRQIVLHSPKSSSMKIRAIIHVKCTAISSSTVLTCISKEFVLKSPQAGTKPILNTTEEKEIGLCQTSLPLDCCQVEERVCFLRHAPHRHLYLATCTLDSYWVSIWTRNMF